MIKKITPPFQSRVATRSPNVLRTLGYPSACRDWSIYSDWALYCACCCCSHSCSFCACLSRCTSCFSSSLWSREDSICIGLRVLIWSFSLCYLNLCSLLSLRMLLLFKSCEITFIYKYANSIYVAIYKLIQRKSLTHIENPKNLESAIVPSY